MRISCKTVPLPLLLPGTFDETVEILPDSEMAGAAAIGWFTGTTSATPAGVTRDQTATSRLERTMRLNAVDEDLDIQRRNLFQLESSLDSFTMVDELKEHQRERAKHIRGLINSLEQERDSLLHMLAQNGDHDGG